MAVIVPAPPALTGELSLFHTTDPLLSNSPVLVFHGPAATIGATSSRIQVHVFTPAGYASYARLAVSPNSPFYSAVSNLPREEQGDETVRGLAFGLKKYFAELSEALKKTWCAEGKAPSPSALFGDDHIAILASRMTKVDNVDEVVEDIKCAFGEQRLSWKDVDVVLPSGTIKPLPEQPESSGSEEADESRLLVQRYGKYAELVDSLGEVAFLPTSRVKRAPSKPTSLGRSASFLKHQKESVRKELSELLDTEESYVTRVRELAELYESVNGSLEPADRATLREILPTTIKDIAELNSEFLERLRSVMEATEQTAQRDIDKTSEQETLTRQPRDDYIADTQGVGAVARCLCEWVPKFNDSYSLYMQTHAQATQLLRTVLRGSESALTTKLQDIGEQKFTSLLIEPVQRLPRYNLYIDSIIKQLPIRHPAIKPLLKARDAVTEVCDKEEDIGAATITALEKLRSRVSGWPAESLTTGRLVTAADFVELIPPYAHPKCEVEPGMLLLFTDALVFLEKHGDSTTNARALLTEIENAPPPLRQAHHPPGTPRDLQFLRRVALDDVHCLETLDGQALQVMISFGMGKAAHPSQTSKVNSCQMIRLLGSYERKAERLAEEIVKARIEGRFSEPERESQRWEVRTSDPAAEYPSLLCAVYEDSQTDYILARASAASTRILVDIDKHSQRPRAGQNGVRTILSVSPQRGGMWRLTIDAVNGTIGREDVTIADLVPVMRRKLSPLFSAQYAIEQPAMTACLLARNAHVLQSLDIHFAPDDNEPTAESPRRERVHRPMSPKKLLSSFLSSTGPGTQPPPVLKKDLPPLPPPVQLHRGLSTSSTVSKPPSRDSRPSSKDQPTPSSMSSVRSHEPPANTLKKLEETLSAYTLALQARKGNIVGRNLKMRGVADELAVNDLYNSLLDDPNMMVAAAQASVDVLFAAFEKFLNIAWKESVGQVLPLSVIQDIQAKAEVMFPADFDECFKSTLSAQPPQNQRAFKTIMKLLADLLDGTGNDSDRGMLTAAFAEILVTDGNPHEYIALIDRFIDDPDTYFGEPLDEANKTGDGAFNPNKRARTANAGSVSSNTSSLRKKFGFGGLSRENSKSEPESKVAAVWRTLSKTARGDASPASGISRGTLQRSHSTDADARVGASSRPVSQDGALLSNSSLLGDESLFSGLSSNLNLGLSTIGEHPSFIPTGPPRKKRRSSLSDLKALEVSQQKSPPAWSPAAARRLPTAQRLEDKSLPSSPMPSTPSSKGGSGRFGTPSKEPARSRLPSSFRKENSPGPTKAYSTSDLRPKSSSGKPDEVVITARPTSGIPSLAPKTPSPNKAAAPAQSRVGLAERPGAGNIIKLPSPQPDKPAKPAVGSVAESGSPKKLRMQSPQKLRERLQNEQSAIAAAHTSLQDELSKIGDELTSTPSRIGSVRTGQRNSATQSSNMDLTQRVLKMEGQLSNQISELSTRVSNIQSDLATSLNVSETKCKKLDELYREANGENEALYTRFNDELGRILKAVRGGEGVEELKKKLKESQEEATKLKRENVRLKRENVGLRAQLKE